MSSENVDSFAQEYLERARKRREMLAQKLADTSPRRKRTVPLLESQQINISPPKAVDDDSPNKRQCLREDEMMKADTPAIPSVRSRMKTLVSERSNWENGDTVQVDTTPVHHIPRLDVECTPGRDVSPAPSARKNRLAALADNINTWEEDLHHTLTKKEEVKKHTWEPPKTSMTPNPTTRGRDPVRRVHNSAPSKSTRTYDHEIEGRRSMSPVKATSPVREVKQDGSNVISSLTVTLGATGGGVSAVVGKPTRGSPVKQPATKSYFSPIKEDAQAPSPGKSPHRRDPSPVKSMYTKYNRDPSPTRPLYQRDPSPTKPLYQRDPSPTKPLYQRDPSPTKPLYQRDPSPTKPLYHRDPSPVKPAIASRVAALQQDSTRRRESFEPSAQPVSARLAGWQDRVNQVESDKLEPQNNAASRIHIQPKTISPQKATCEEPTAKSVHSRMASWEHKTQEEEREKTAKQAGFVASSVKHTPKSTRAPSPADTPASVVSPIKSPGKVAPGAKAIHGKLQQLQQGWKKNEISEQIKNQRQADLAVLENRWKDGVLREEVHTSVNQPKTVVHPTSSNGVPPPPPPLPTSGSATHRTKSPKKQASPTKAAPKTPRTPRVNEGARNKIRAVHQELIEQVMGEQNGGGKSANQDPYFESKLKTLGFEIESKTESGHVATLDLKEQRETDRLKREAEKNQKKSPKKQPTVKVTEEIVTSFKFSDDKVTTQSKITEPRTPVTVRSTTAVTPGGSLYSLIRKQTPGGTPASLPDLSTRARPAGQKFHDSFSSDETSFEDEPEPQSNKPTSITITTNIRRPASTSSDYSESQATTQSDDDYSDTEYSMDDTEMTQSDDGLESEEEGGISSLLDEAMDDTVTEPPIPAPRRRSPSPQYISHKLPPEAHPGHPDHRHPSSSNQKTHQGAQSIHQGAAQSIHHGAGQSIHQGAGQSSRQATQPAVVMRQKAPPKHPRLQTDQKEEKRVAFTSPGGSTYRSNSSGSERSVKREIVHSVDNYRNSQNFKRNAPEPRLKIIRRSEHFDPDNEVNEKLPFIPQESSKQKLRPGMILPHVQSLLQDFQDLVNQEQIIIRQTSNALNQCYSSDPLFAGPDRAVECHRILLQSCKKREAYLTEMELLRNGKQQVLAGPKGSLTISDIRLPLKREFVKRLRDEDLDLVDSVYYYIVLFRQGAHVIFTQMVSTDDKLVSDSLDVPNHLANIEIRQDFRIDMEIYSMSIAREVAPPENKTPKKKKGMTPKKMMSASKKHHPSYMQSPGGPAAVRTSDFTLLSSLPLTLNMVNKTHFSLAGIPYNSPLYGTVSIKLRCLLEVLVEEKGFLTMFEDVSGLGAWHRRWCVLKHNMLSYWKYPDDSKFKDPINQIDLKSCISDEVGLIARDLCARPNTFELLSVRRQHRGESDTLVTSCYNTMTTTKHWLSADTKEDRYVWCHKLNEAMRNLRAWNPDALRPIKRHPKPQTDTGV